MPHFMTCDTPRPYDIVALGDPVLDVVVHTEHLPRWDDKALGADARFFAGGSEANAVSAAARLNARTALFGILGADLDAEFSRQALLDAGVSDVYLRQNASARSAKALVCVSPTTGERAITYIPARDPDDRKNELLAMLPSTRCIYTLPYDLKTFADVAQAARREGTQVVVDVERAVAMQAHAASIFSTCCDVLFFNEGGFHTLFGATPDATTAGFLIHHTRAHTMVVSLGHDGALAVDRSGGVARQPAYTADVVDTTGAGDTFNAAFLAAYLQLASLQEALSAGCAAACLCVETVGARAALSWEAVRAAQGSRAPLHHNT